MAWLQFGGGMQTILQTARSLCIHARLKISVFLEVAELQKHGPAAHAGVKLW
jgi:hypothetical protein